MGWLHVRAQRNMNLKQLRLVREIVRSNFHVTDAASALFTSQSGVSKHIKDLEDELGIELFERRGKRLLGLTEPGSLVLKMIDRALLEVENIRQVAGTLAKSSHGTPDDSRHAHAKPICSAENRLGVPKFVCDVEIVLLQAHPREIPALLLSGQADVGFATDIARRRSGSSDVSVLFLGARRHRARRTSAAQALRRHPCRMSPNTLS